MDNLEKKIVDITLDSIDTVIDEVSTSLIDIEIDDICYRYDDKQLILFIEYDTTTSEVADINVMNTVDDYIHQELQLRELRFQLGATLQLTFTIWYSKTEAFISHVHKII